jgi:hypothetical protein
MASVTKSFTAEGVSTTLQVPLVGTDVRFSLSGTYAATIFFERATTSDATSWETIPGSRVNGYSVANETVSFIYTTLRNDGRYRVRCTSYTSGTAVVVLRDVESKNKSFLFHPDYVSGNWYLPIGCKLDNTTMNSGANSIRFLPFLVPSPLSIQKVGFRISTGAAGNAQIAIYASDPITKKPTGFSIASTASMDTSSSNSNQSGVLSVTLEERTLNWLAFNIDNASATGPGATSVSSDWGALLGGATQANVLPNVIQSITGYSFATTFGTWPDMTQQTVVVLNASTVPMMQFQVA